ncbi:MAG: PilZ domain-containing protein [Deltaproteobacteria bacterium]|nr:PilZ domain-containing protein [Deltaproteobacteria bacterium]
MRHQILKMRFDSQAALRAEFEKNISNRGIFVATDAELEVRQIVEVEIALAYAAPGAASVVLRGEVVHRVSPEMVRGGGRAGVAIQFEETVAELKARFEPLLGDEPLPDPDVDQAGERRRSARREPVRVPIRVRVGKREPFDATSRDLSATGVLLSVREDRIAVGEIVRIGLRHPVDGTAVEIGGRVVREVKNKGGNVAAVAVAFDRKQAAEPRAGQVIEALRQASHQGRLGGISGSIVDIGLANLLQMLGSSAPQGTLVVEHAGEQGFIAFADNQFVAAELASLRGRAAIEEMLGWSDGRFEFEARVDASLLARKERAPLAAVVLEAVCARDERGRPGPVAGDRAAAPTPKAIPADATFDADATFEVDASFEVDVEQEEIARGSLEKTEEAVLDLARAGMSLARIESIIPEPPARVRAAIASLVEMGVLIPR